MTTIPILNMPYPSPAQVELLYAQRAKQVADLARRGSIKADDLPHLDRLGRFKIVVEHWPLCDESARQALLKDTHHSVRSAAILA